MNSYDNKIIKKDMLNIFKSGLDYKRFNGKTFFITGGTGMLASYMVYFLIYLNENVKNFNCKIILLVKNSDKVLKRFGEYTQKEYFKTYTGSVLDEIKIEEKIDYIVHAASIAVTQYFKDYPIDVILPNSLGTYRLLELACKNNVESFLYFSTVSIYGKIENKTSITEDSYGILDTLDQNSCYSESKRLGETLCKAYWNQKQVKTKIVRISHTYGPTLDLDTDKRVFSEFINNILNHQNIEMKSSGSEVRSFCYLSDATEAFFRILLDGESGEAYNMSNPSANVSILELAKILCKTFKDRNIKITYKSKEKSYVKNKFSNSIIFSIDKIQKLGWIPKVGVEKGFKRTVESFEKSELYEKN